MEAPPNVGLASGAYIYQLTTNIKILDTSVRDSLFPSSLNLKFSLFTVKTMSKPTIVFLPGAWLPQPPYASFLQALKQAGYHVCYISYPSCNSVSADCQ